MSFLSNRASRLTVHLGEHNVYIEEGTEQRIGAEKVIPHRNITIILMTMISC